MEYCFVNCAKCGKTLRIPKYRGLLDVKCPICSYQFRYNSGEIDLGNIYSGVFNKQNNARGFNIRNSKESNNIKNDKPKKEQSFFARKREEKRQKKEEDNRKIRNSPLTQALIEDFYNRFSDAKSEEVAWLRQKGFYKLEVNRDFVILRKCSGRRNEPSEIALAYSFEKSGYERLPNYDMAIYMKDLIIEKISQISYIRVSDSDYIFGNDNIRTKW